MKHSSVINRKAPASASIEQAGVTSPRPCQGQCGEVIPAKRLLAQPNARLCVPCLVAAGDVAPIKRFDEVGRDGEIHQTFFTKDRRIERQINHFNKADVAGAEDFNVVGDDDHLRPDVNEIIAVGRSLATVFIPDEPAVTQLLSIARIQNAVRTSAAAVNDLQRAA